MTKGCHSHSYQREMDPAQNDYLENSESGMVKELHIAPMLAVTYSEFRYLMRILTKRATLWTEMIVDETLVHIDKPEKKLEIHKIEHPVVCQLGGNHPEWTARSVVMVEQAGYDEVNMNAECPSNLVCGRHEFGAALMKNAELAVTMLKAMRVSARNIPVSIKMRIAIDDDDSWDDYLVPYIRQLREESGCRRFYLHARKVYTTGLCPAKNRLIPPLNYPLVYRLCRLFRDCDFWINGGLKSLAQAKEVCYGHHPIISLESLNSTEADHTCVPCTVCNAPYGSCITAPDYPSPSNLRGCMVGRLAMDNPAAMALVDTYFYGEKSNPCRTRREVLDKYCSYIEERYPPLVDPTHLVVTRQPTDESDDSPLYAPVEQSRHCSKARDSNDVEAEQEPYQAGMPTYIIDRTLKPIMGMFAGMSGGNKSWRRLCTKFSRDMTIRDFGPAFCIRKAMEHMPDNLLDREF